MCGCGGQEEAGSANQRDNANARGSSSKKDDGDREEGHSKASLVTVQ